MGRKQSKKDLNEKARQRRENQRTAHKTGETNPDDSNQFILVSKKKKKEKKDTFTPERILSKAQKKKLEKLWEKKEKQKKRKELFESLERNKMGSNAHLLQASSQLGQKETSRQKIRRHFREQNAGLEVESGEDSRLFVHHDAVDVDADTAKDVSSTSDKLSTSAASDTQMFSGAEVVKVTPTVTGLMRKSAIPKPNFSTNFGAVKVSKRKKRKRTIIMQGGEAVSSYVSEATQPSSGATTPSTQPGATTSETQLKKSGKKRKRTNTPDESDSSDDSSSDDDSGSDSDMSDSGSDSDNVIDKERCVNLVKGDKRRTRNGERDESESSDNARSDSHSDDDIDSNMSDRRSDSDNVSDNEESSPPVAKRARNSTDSKSKSAAKLDHLSDSSSTTEESAAKTGKTPDSAAPGSKNAKSKPAKRNIPKIKKFVVHLDRDADIQARRLELPILGKEQEIVEAIQENDVTIICAETGSGKTTQIPQFLYEIGYSFGERQKKAALLAQGHNSDDSSLAGGIPGLIGVTEPRRIAAVTMSERVGKELNRPNVVSYQIRYDSKVTDDTAIKFMTDGILLKEIQSDFLLRKYSVIMLDEAHERNINTDVLIGLLSRIVPLRRQLADEHAAKQLARSSTSQSGKAPSGDAKSDAPEPEPILPLKLVITSATLRVDDFLHNSRLFPIAPPLVEVTARQFPVAVHFNKRTPLEDYADDMFSKACKIHQRLPAGGILMFMTGRQEIERMCTRLRERFRNVSDAEMKKMPKVKALEVANPRGAESDAKAASSSVSGDRNAVIDGELSDSDDDMEDDEEVINDPRLMAKSMDDVDDETDTRKGGSSKTSRKPTPVGGASRVRVLPLYSILPQHMQLRVFDPLPEDVRLIVVATNVAETSLTIPGVKYVVDSGKEKRKVYDEMTGMSSFVVDWISKSSSEQRAGRAGRTGPGHCYRLYSAAVFDRYFPQYSEPEIVTCPIDSTVLQMKAMDIEDVENFPFPTPPEASSIHSALRLLNRLDACASRSKDYRITPLGRTLSVFPVSVRFAKMLVVSHQGGLLPFLIAIVASLSVDELQLVPSDFQDDEQKTPSQKKGTQQKKGKKAGRGSAFQKAKSQFVNRESDFLSNLKIVGAFAYANSAGRGQQFCADNFLRFKQMHEIEAMRRQLNSIVLRIQDGEKKDGAPSKSALAAELNRPLGPPTKKQGRLIRQVITSGFIDRIARKWPKNVRIDDDDAVNYQKLNGAYQCTQTNEPVYIHPSSNLFAPEHQPSFLVYQHLHRSDASSKKAYMRGVSLINPEWLSKLAPSQCSVSKPLQNPPPRYSSELDDVSCFVTVHFGAKQWALPMQKVSMPASANRTRWFARFLLEGLIFTDLKEFSEFLVARPATAFAPVTAMTSGSRSLGAPSDLTSMYAAATSSASRLVDTLVRTLEKHSITKRSQLLEIWSSNENFLLPEVLTWVSSWKQARLREIWPPQE